MEERFAGEDGKRLLVDAIKAQQLIEHDAELAKRIVDMGALSSYKPGDLLIEQGSADNHVLFLLDGEAGVFVNNRHVATRRPRESVGEMALVEGTARRSATVSALKPVLALRLAESDFFKIAADFPAIWRAIARVVAERLRQRVQFHHPPNERPVLFLGSSVEGLQYAQHIQAGLKFSKAVAQLWTNRVFGPGGVVIDDLLGQAEKSDFAVFVFGPDDRITSRDEEYMAPRDNVVFELGLFMGRLDRNRAIIVMQHGANIKIPSDLLGLTVITYVAKPGADIAATMGPVCTELDAHVSKIGVK